MNRTTCCGPSGVLITEVSLLSFDNCISRGSGMGESGGVVDSPKILLGGHGPK